MQTNSMFISFHFTALCTAQLPYHHTGGEQQNALLPSQTDCELVRSVIIKRSDFHHFEKPLVAAAWAIWLFPNKGHRQQWHNAYLWEFLHPSSSIPTIRMNRSRISRACRKATYRWQIAAKWQHLPQGIATTVALEQLKSKPRSYCSTVNNCVNSYTYYIYMYILCNARYSNAWAMRGNASTV